MSFLRPQTVQISTAFTRSALSASRIVQVMACEGACAHPSVVVSSWVLQCTCYCILHSASLLFFSLHFYHIASLSLQVSFFHIFIKFVFLLHIFLFPFLLLILPLFVYPWPHLYLSVPDQYLHSTGSWYGMELYPAPSTSAGWDCSNVKVMLVISFFSSFSLIGSLSPRLSHLVPQTHNDSRRCRQIYR